MNSSYYNHCIVPQCKRTTIKTPNKLFIYVSNNEQIRKKWLKLARRDDVHSLSTNSRMYFCADHFDSYSRLKLPMGALPVEFSRNLPYLMKCLLPFALFQLDLGHNLEHVL
ncbi:hypothetical protein NQ317_017835 [Molorchus minor]|uniref:THAP-type domain-containing protein n=1 Tax=Molorchus minor TaxID=1323400 RepID=A0ABQ9J714_9CUCU|nr:hypothetical protein NQ317_017835 [Molorchus minor]